MASEETTNDENSTETKTNELKASIDQQESQSLTEEMQTDISIQQMDRPQMQTPSPLNIKDCLISALSEFDENSNEHSSPINSDENSNETKEETDDHALAKIMRPIRELIYKSFNQPSEAEEGIEFVRSSLQNQTNNKDLLIMSIGHFLSIHLPPSWIDSMCKFMLDRMQLILLKFFTFKHYCSCYFNCNISNSRLFVLQCALHRRFPLLISEGCASLSRSPVFYFNRSLFNENNIECSSWRLLQNRLSFKSVPLHRSTHHQTPRMAKKQKKDDVVNDNIVTPLSMDLRTLEQEIERDQSKGRLPCVVIASPTDNLQKIRSICDRHGLWLHIEGGSNSLLLAAATTLPKSTRIMMQCADSITCKPFEWFKDASDSDKMLAKTLSETNPKIINKGSPNNINFKVMRGTKSYFGNDVAGCSSTLTFIREDLRDSPPPKIQYSDSDFVMMFPLWHCLVTRSIKQIKNRVDHCLNLCKYLNQQLNERKNIFGTQSMRMPASLIFQIVPNMSVIDLQQFKLDINS